MKESADNYVLMTAARNEAAYIEGTIRAVLTQTYKPKRWVIVSDGSTDETDNIIKDYARSVDFIVLARRDDDTPGVDFRRKVKCLRQALNLLAGISYEFIGNLDADITFGPAYFETLVQIFQQNPKLGLAGGRLFELRDGHFLPRYLSENRYVPGAVQFFRRECFEQVGGYLPSRWGGEDTIAVVSARMAGWQTATITHLQVIHHKIGDGTRGLMFERFREGAMFYDLGSQPVIEFLKCVRCLIRKPYAVQALARFCGYISRALRREPRPVSNEFIRYLRQEQKVRLLRTLQIIDGD